MPRLRPRNWKPRKDEIVLCIETFSNVGGFVVCAGDELSGDHELVKNHLQYFAPFDTPASEWPSPFREAIESPASRHPKQADLQPSIPPERQVRAADSFSAPALGVDVVAGHIHDRESEVVRRYPQHFEELPKRLA